MPNIYKDIYKYLLNIIILSRGSDIRLYSESELCKKFACSRATVRQAYSKLKTEGLVYSKQGSGNYIMPPKIRYELSSKTSYTKEIEKTNRTPSLKILDKKEIKSDKKIAEKFRIEEGEDILKINILRFVDNIPFLYSVSYLNMLILQNIRKKIENLHSLTKLAKEEYGIEFVREHSELEIILSDNKITKKLNLQNSIPLVKIASTSLDKKNGRVVEYCESYFRGDMAKIVINYKE